MHRWLVVMAVDAVVTPPMGTTVQVSGTKKKSQYDCCARVQRGLSVYRSAKPKPASYRSALRRPSPTNRFNLHISQSMARAHVHTASN